VHRAARWARVLPVVVALAGCGASGDQEALDRTPEKLNETPSREFEQEDLDRAEDASETVKDYCAYGAMSEAQLVGCTSSVTHDDATSRDTNAAAYARGELDECLSDAGPFCKPR
jgi:hypothetical protein